MPYKKILLIGKSGRLDCMAEALCAGQQKIELHILSEVTNSSLERKGKVIVGKSDDVEFVTACARELTPDLAVVGPEEPLAAGVVNRLNALGIGCVGPTKELAQLESSKSFTRKLLDKHQISGNPEYAIFHSLSGIREYAKGLGEFVVKPDGLSGGKGVKVFGEHLFSLDDAMGYCSSLFESGATSVVIEERMEGEEFSLQSMFDGRDAIHTPLVQDHKRALEGDAGANTGGMGSYSCADHGLPFVTSEHVRMAQHINACVGEAVSRELGEDYKGILYGGFMVTPHGLRVVEYNARFGDPEAMNVLPILETDFVEVCEAIVASRLDSLKVQFKNLSTVCKYVVPKGYPSPSSVLGTINASHLEKAETSDRLHVFYGAVSGGAKALQLAGSRAIAVVGVSPSLAAAEQIAENAASSIEGPVFHRRDIGTAALVQKRVDHMKQLSRRLAG